MSYFEIVNLNKNYDGKEVLKNVNISLPPFDGGKDISDLYKSLQDKTKFKQTLLKLIKN